MSAKSSKRERSRLVSAQVVLRAASGRDLDDLSVVTAETLSEFAPSDQTVAEATRAFDRASFEVGPMIGIGFSITASLHRFEDFFRVRLRSTKGGSVTTVGGDLQDPFQLPLDALPKSMARHVVAVTFTEPPEFGPTGSFGP